MTLANTVNALTIDVEEYYHAHVIARHSPVGSPRESRVVRSTDRLLEILDAAGVTATFFVLGRVAEQQPELVRKIHRRGHEIASHGWSHALIYQQDREEFREETRRSKEALEDLIGAEVVGYRASTFSVRSDSLWALRIIAEAGFRYDSSIAPVHHDLYGLSQSPADPYRILIDDSTTLLELPVATVSVFGVRVVVGGGGYFRLLPYSLIRAGLKHLGRAGRPPFVFYVHPWEFDPDQPRVESLPALSRVRHYTNLDKTEVRFQSLLRDFKFSSIVNALSQLSAGCTTIPVAQLS